MASLFRASAIIGSAFFALAACSTDPQLPPPDSGPGVDAAKDAKPAVCIGIRPPQSAWGAPPGPIKGDADVPDTGSDASVSDASVEASCTGPTCIGSSAPVWQLEDFQPQSCGYKATYGLDVFKGHVTVVVLLQGWCPYCQQQAFQLSALRGELRKEGKDVEILIINGADAANDQAPFVERTSVPLFQDLTTVDAWGLHGGAKDDFFIYDKNGVLGAYLPFASSNTNLSTALGYSVVKDAILSVTK